MNTAFTNKLIKDELKDTLFFATGEYVQSMKKDGTYSLETNQFKVIIKGYKNIMVNEERCKSPREAKWQISHSI